MQPIFANGTIKSDRTLHFHSFLECFSLVQQPSPCFARYFILAIAVNLVQDQIWSWSSRTFHVEFDRVNQSAWSLPLKFFNFKFKSSETKDGWHFLRFFNATTCIQSQKSTFNHLYTTNSTKITFSKTTFIKLLQYSESDFYHTFIHLLSKSISWINESNGVRILAIPRIFPFVQSTMLRYTITRNKETEDGKNRSVV